MPALDFNHGTRVIQAGTNPRPIALANMRPIGAIMVAPDADTDVFPLNEPVAFYSDDTAKKTAAGAGGNVKDVFDAIDDQGVTCEIVVVRVGAGAGANAQAQLESTLTNIVGSSASMTGVHAFKGSQAHTGVKPRLLIAPGFTDMRIDNAANPAVTELTGIATRLKGMIVADADASTREAANTWRGDYANQKRIYAVTPMGKVFEDGAYVNRPLSGRVAAMFNKRWKEKGGPYFSPSNQTILGIGGTSRPITYYDGEIDHDANWLNSRGLATVIERTTLWGNRTLATDANDVFVNVVITQDAIEESIVGAFRWAMDKNLSSHLGVAIIETLETFLSELRAVGAIIGGKASFDRTVNSWASLMAGKLRVEYDFEPAAPLEDLIFGAHRNPYYYEVLASDIITLLQRNSAA